MWMDEAACLKTGLIFGHLLIPNSGLKVEQDKEFEPCKLSAIKNAELQEFLAHLYDE